MEILYEKITKKDYKDIKLLILKAWYSEGNAKLSLKKLFVDAYFYSLIKGSNYGVKAVVNGQFAGFVLGSINRPSWFHRFKYSILLFLTRFCYLFSKYGRQNLKVDILTDRVDEKLLHPYKKELTSELTLFIVNENYRKNGIGSHLVNLYISELKNKNISQFYLFTDTYSNYQYYDNNNYIRLNTIHVVFDKKNHDEGDYYIYLKKLEG